MLETTTPTLRVDLQAEIAVRRALINANRDRPVPVHHYERTTLMPNAITPPKTPDPAAAVAMTAADAATHAAKADDAHGLDAGQMAAALTSAAGGLPAAVSDLLYGTTPPSPAAANAEPLIDLSEASPGLLITLLPAEPQAVVRAGLADHLGYGPDAGAPRPAHDPARFLDRPDLSFEDALLLFMVAVLKIREGDIENDARALSDAESEGGAAGDVEMTKLSRKVDVRNNLFNALRGVIESFQRSGERVAQSIGQ